MNTVNGVNKVMSMTRMVTRRGRLLAGALLLAVLLAVVSSPGLAAFQMAKGRNIVVEKGRTITGDLYASGGTTIVEGTVTGDLVAFADTVIVNGRVDGSILAFGGDLTVNGPVGGNIRAVCRSLTVNSSVGKNVTVFGGSVLFGPSAAIDGGLIGFVASLQSQAKIADDVLVGLNNVKLGGKVGGFVRIAGERVTVLPDAEVNGKFTYYSPNRAVIPNSARLAGGVRYEPAREADMVVWEKVWRALRGGWFLGVLLLGTLLWLFYPERLRGVTAPETTTWTRGFLLGLLGLVVTPVVAVVGFATLIGIPVALALMALYGFGLLLTLPLAGSLAARQVIATYRPGLNWHPVLVALVGMLGIGVLRLIPILGPLFGFLSFILGFGLFMQSLVSPARPREEAV